MNSRVEIWVVMNNQTNLKRTSKISATITDDIGVINDPQLRVGSGAVRGSDNLGEIDRYVKFNPQDTITPVDAAGKQGPGGELPPYIPPPQPPQPYQSLSTQTGVWSLDLFPNDTQVPITYQLSDIQDISTVNSSYTKTINLPGTKNNLEAFGFIFDINSDATFNPNKRCKAYVLADSVPVLEGYIQLLKVVDNQDLGVARFECVIYADNANFWTELGDATIDMLPMQELEHNRDFNTILQSWTASSSSLGYYYPLIDYGGWGTTMKLHDGPGDQDFYASGDWGLTDIGGVPQYTQYKVTPEMLFPAVYVKTVFDKIFQQANFQYQSNFLNSSYFKNLLIPFNRDKLKRAISWEWNKTFRAGLGVIPGGFSGAGYVQNVFTPTQSHATQSTGWWDLIPSVNYNIATPGPNSQLPFLGNIRGIGNLWLGNADGNYYGSNGVRIRFTDTNGNEYAKFHPEDFDRGRVWNTGAFAYEPYNGSNNGTYSATANDGWTGRMKFRFGVYYKITEFGQGRGPVGRLSNVYGSELSLRRTYGSNGVPIQQYAVAPTRYGATNYKDYSTGFVPDINRQNLSVILADGYTASTNSVVIKAGATVSYAGDIGKVYEGYFYSAWLDGSTPNCYPSYFGESFFLEYQSSLYGIYPAGRPMAKIDPETAIWIEFFPELGPGETVDMQQVLPLNVKQKDFIMSITKMFNLQIEPVKNEANMLKIEPRDDFYATGTEKDWTYKVDRNKDIEIKILGEVGTKTTTFKFKDDSDYFNADYKKRWEETYGQYTFNNDNDFAQSEKKIEVSFSPTPVAAVPASQGFVIPKIAKINNNVFERTNSNIRIVRRTTAGLLANPYSEIWRFGATGSPGQVLTSYPYVGHFDNPYTPTDDLNFGQTYDLYYPQEQATNQNLFTKFYWQQMQEYADKNSRVMTAEFYLTPQDIAEFKFNDKILIDRQYWKVVKIEGFDPTQRATTKVTLIKSLTYTAPQPKRVKVNPKLQTGIIGALGASTNVILSAGSGAIGTGNIIGGASKGTLIIGSGNLLAANNQNTLISGDNNSIGIFASNSNIFGSQNTILDNSTATITGSENIVATQSQAVIFGSSNSVAPNLFAQITGSNNLVKANHQNTGDIVAIYGSNNIVGTNSASSFVFGANNIIEASSTQSVSTIVLGSSNIVYPDAGSVSANPVNLIVGKNNTILPSDQDTFVFGSLNVVGTQSSSYVVGTGNVIADSVTQSIVLGNNNIVNSSTVNVIGSDNIVATNSNAAIIGYNNTFVDTVVDSIAIGKNITATEDNKVYISDVIFTAGGTGSALSLENTLAVGNDPKGQVISGTLSLFGAVGGTPEIGIEITSQLYKGGLTGSLARNLLIDTNGSGFSRRYLDRIVSGDGTYSYQIGDMTANAVSTIDLTFQAWNYNWSEFYCENSQHQASVYYGVGASTTLSSWTSLTGARTITNIQLSTGASGELYLDWTAASGASDTWHFLVDIKWNQIIVPV